MDSFFFTALRGRRKTLGVRSGQRRQWWVAEVSFLVYLSHTLLIGLCWAALLYCLPSMTKVFFSLKLYPVFFFSPLNLRKCLFIRFCSCGCSVSPFFTNHESDIQSCFLFSTSFCHLASHAS
uniref:Uncharacterized protein n=1 Tax=Rhipicephalus zambeziensis TaxID=60191 RepID=A0A224YGB0_9ACAR